MTLAVIIALGACLLSPPATTAMPQDPQQPQSEPTTSQTQSAPPSKSDAPEEKRAQPSTPQPPTAQPSPAQEKPPASSEAPADKSTKTKKSKKGKTAKETTPPPPAPAPPSDAPKVVVKEGSTPEPTVQLSQGMSEDQISKQKQTTEDLLSNTDENLKKIAALQLNASQQDMVAQIHTYMDQAKAAVSAGDVQRGHNLANKARLLSEDLLKR
jgi:hypothetical protein